MTLCSLRVGIDTSQFGERSRGSGCFIRVEIREEVGARENVGLDMKLPEHLGAISKSSQSGKLKSSK